MIRQFSLFLACMSAGAAALHAQSRLELRRGDHIAIVGNALADRMQHDGTLEAFIHKAHPQDDISVRNLGFAADEITSHVRSDDVPTTEDWLKKLKADVVLAFWGFNESFHGYEGIEKFKADLDKYLKGLKAARFDGADAPRVVLFSPIAQEKLADANMPDPTQNNTNLQNYAAAMAEVAKANDVQFVDLYAPSQQLYKDEKQPLTHNGIHLTVAGYQALAPVIYKALFGSEPPAKDASFEKLRQAVLVKNDEWLSRYRTVDQYNIFGGRSTIGYESGKGGPKIDNRAVLWPELEVRDVMTENREKRVWALAKGSDLTIDDSNLPAIPKIGTNDPGSNPDGSYKYLGAEEAIKHMKVPKGVKVELVASEEQFPDLVSPVQMAWDPSGRLWISSWKNYPERTPQSKSGDKLLIFDIGPDGKATKCTTFLDNLNCPTGFQFYKDGIFVMESPDLWFVRGAQGYGPGVLQERVLDGLDAADSHHETNAFAIDPGGAYYLSDGVFFRTQVETAAGPVRNVNGALYRWEPRTGRFDQYVAYDFANPHGKVFTYWGDDLMTDATGNANYYGPGFSGHIDAPMKHPNMKQFWDRPSRPCPGTALLSSRAWPKEYQDSFLNCNVISVQGIFRVKLSEEGSGIKGETQENLITSDDPNFRPSGITVAPDGSLYFMDWHKPLIGHLQHHLRDPNREMDHGRIYRLTYEGMPLLQPAKIAGEPIPKLLDLLKTPENNVRERAKIELGGRDTGEVVRAVDQWLTGLDKSDPDYEHHVLEGLWVKSYHNVVDAGLLQRELQSPNYHVRAQAVRVLCYWRDRINEPLALLKIAANDESPRVRLEAVRAASFFNGADVRDAFLVACEALKRDTDYYIDYCFQETTRQLQHLSKEVLLPTDPKALAYVVSRMSDAELAKAPEVEPVLEARLERKETDVTVKEKALGALAALHHTGRVQELVSTIERLEGKRGGGAEIDQLTKMLSLSSAEELGKSRGLLISLAEKAQQNGSRRAAWVALLTADANPDKTWPEAKTPAAREALIESIGYLMDPGLRTKFQPMLVAALADPQLSAGARSAVLNALPLTGAEFSKANFSLIAASLQKGIARPAAARALMQLPRDAWDKNLAGPLTESILAYARSVPNNDRSAQDYVEVVQAGNELAGLLAPEDATRVRKELRGLGVSVFVVKTVREQMRYDTPRLVVEAGKPFEVIFENMDLMGHNFVIVEPGARKAVAEAAQTMPPTQLDKQGRAFLPKNDKRVVAATRLVEPGQKEVLKVTAPQKEGEYEYVCTFPGHWMIMWGTLVVTNNPDAKLQESAAPAPK